VNDIGVIHLVGKHGGYAAVDVDLLEELNCFKWRLNNEGYVARYTRFNGKRAVVLLHRVVNKTPVGVLTDHRNGFKIDCTRRNLRNATNTENAANSDSRDGTSRYKGVSWYARFGKWRAQIQINGHKKHLGCFSTEIEAARAHDRAALQLFGEYAKVNEPC
jgi:hypothetical protein